MGRHRLTQPSDNGCAPTINRKSLTQRGIVHTQGPSVHAIQVRLEGGEGRGGEGRGGGE